MPEKPMTLRFRCPAELEGVLPAPVPALSGLPGWLKSMPPQAFNALNGRDENTVKRCPPFVDAMTHGFLIPLMCDLRFDKGEVTWDRLTEYVSEKTSETAPTLIGGGAKQTPHEIGHLAGRSPLLVRVRR